jgi:hypothetical protein
MPLKKLQQGIEVETAQCGGVVQGETVMADEKIISGEPDVRLDADAACFDG